MNNKSIIILAGVFFLMVNTSYFWFKLPGMWDLAITLILFAGFILLAGAFFRQLWLAYGSGFKSKARNLRTTILFFVLASSIAFPFGIIDFANLDGEPLLIAERVNSSDCKVVIKLKENDLFLEEDYCLGVERGGGTYIMDGDTIRFSFEGESLGEYNRAKAFIQPSQNPKKNDKLIYLRDKKGLLPITMEIVTNEL